MTQQLEAGEVGKRADEYVLRLDQYNHHTFPIELTSGTNNTPIDATGASLIWTIRRKAGDASPLKTITITWTDRATGKATASVYIDLPCGPRETDLASQYFHEMVYVDSLGNILTSIKGPCIVNRGALRP
jgi:hypothetical protein